MSLRVMHMFITQLRPHKHQASECTVPPTVPQSLEPENLTHSYLQTYGLPFSSTQAALLWYHLTVQLSSWGDNGGVEPRKTSRLGGTVETVSGQWVKAEVKGKVEERPTATSGTIMEVHWEPSVWKIELHDGQYEKSYNASWRLLCNGTS